MATIPRSLCAKLSTPDVSFAPGASIDGAFSMGQLVMTAGINDLVAEDKAFAKHVWKSLIRYIRKDWGELDKEDKRSNEQALKHGGRLMGAYGDKDNEERQDSAYLRIWIITEADRSVTTILFPSEY